ncbi:PREDICTED: uncharacterized protein LOC109326350 [Lupinus angustifolius]|uniref:uncharacterized protein LOC109326350 n=1 Tax=Lupinus angustifolius TaxID=3871 RepID=UPI00092EDD38|nr:PREDICTED: uncharacterized protein LOC109326350 [Lupinus angustifolius]
MATTRSSQEDVEFWYLDTSCSNHMIDKKDWFTTLDESRKNKIKFADHSVVFVEGIGKVMIHRRVGKKTYILNVLYVPKMKSNLLSLEQLLEKGYTMEMKDGMLKVFDKKQVQHLEGSTFSQQNLPDGIQISDQKCLQSTIMNDTWLWPKSEGIRGGIFRCNKDEVLETFKRFKAQAERQSEVNLKPLRSDGGGEYVSAEFHEFYIKEGITHGVIAPYAPKHNGTTERANRIILNMARCMMKTNNLPKVFWDEVVSIVVYILNRCPTKRLDEKTLE